MSILEIILYSIIGTGGLIWIIHSIIGMKKKKKQGNTEDDDED